MTTLKICLILSCLLPYLAAGKPRFDGATFFMKEIQLSRPGFIALVDDADFDWLNQWRWKVHNKNKYTYYAARNHWPNGKKNKCETILMHRLILAVTDSNVLVDHKDCVGFNNQRNNLRLCNTSQNLCNRKARCTSKSKYLGVCWNKRNNRWVALAGLNYKKTYLGSFKTEEEAALAYNKKAIELHGEFANLNVIK